MSIVVEQFRCQDPSEVVAHLEQAGTRGPSLHPGAQAPDYGYSVPEGKVNRWSGWNDTYAIGYDATGRPVFVGLHHYASGHTNPFAGYVGSTPRLSSDPVWSMAELEFPLDLQEPVAVIRHPEHTPTVCRATFLGEDHRIHWCNRLAHPTSEAHALED